MGELHVNMNITIDGVIQANGGPSEEDAGFAYAGWERPYGDEESGAQITADVQASDALLLGRTTYDIFRRYWPGKTDGIGAGVRPGPEVRRVARHSGAVLGRPARRSPTRPPRSATCGSGTSRSTPGAARTCCRPCSARVSSTR